MAGAGAVGLPSINIGIVFKLLVTIRSHELLSWSKIQEVQKQGPSYIRGKETRMPHIACLLLGHGFFLSLLAASTKRDNLWVMSMAEHTHLPLQEHTTAGASMKKLLFKDGQSGACAAGQYYLRARPVSLRSRSCAHQARVSRAGPSCSRASPAPAIFVQVILCVQPVIVISVNILKQLGVNSQAYLVSRYDQPNIDHFGHTHKSTEQDKITNFRKPLPSWKNTTTNISKEACRCISTIGECIVSGWIRDAQVSHPISHRMLWSRPWHCCLILNPHPCPSLLDLNIRLQSAMRCICICICIWARNSSTP